MPSFVFGVGGLGRGGCDWSSVGWGGNEGFGNGSYETSRSYCETREGDVVANIALCVIHQASFLLDRQIRRLEQDFVKEGGIRERMMRARVEFRRSEKKKDKT